MLRLRVGSVAGGRGENKVLVFESDNAGARGRWLRKGPQRLSSLLRESSGTLAPLTCEHTLVCLEQKGAVMVVNKTYARSSARDGLTPIDWYAITILRRESTEHAEVSRLTRCYHHLQT